jgi:hypothetical protein
MEQPSEPKKTLGCGRGCLIAIAVVAAILLVFFGGASLFYLYIIQHVGSAEPANLELPTPTVGEANIAKLQWQRLRAALAGNREETIEFTAADLNALVAEQTEFARARGRVRFGIEDSAMTMELNAPMRFVPPGFKKRWSYTAWHFTLDYRYGQFTFELGELRTTRGKVPDWLLPQFNAWLKSGLMKRFRDELANKPSNTSMWKHVKTAVLDHDKLVVMTQKI